MEKKREKEQNLNIINPFNNQKENKTINGFVWMMPLVVMALTGLIMIALILGNGYDKEKAKLKLEAYEINNVISDEFSIALNSINLNGYMEIFEQYMKTSTVDMTSSIYYDEATKTLENVTNISDNIVTTFVVAFKNKALVASGITEDVIYNYEFDKQSWYDHKKINQNSMYVSNNFKLEQVSNKDLFAIVRPVVDTMNDEVLGVVAFCYEEDHLNTVFKKNVNDKLDAVIYTDAGKVVLSTTEAKENKTMMEESKEKSNYITARKINESLGWIVETNVHIGKVFLYSWLYLLIIIVMFAIMIFTYMNLINHLKVIKVVDKKVKIVVEDKEEVVEEKVEEEYDDLSIEEVLGEVTVMKDEDSEEELIMSGEIIFNKK